MFWLDGTTIYRAAEATQVAVSTFADATGVSELFGDEQQLYEYGPTAIYSVPTGGGDRTLLRELESPAYYGFKLADGYIYAIDDRGYLARMPRSGGPMKRVANPGNMRHIFVDGDRVISDAGDYDHDIRQIVQQSLSQGVEHVLVQAAPHRNGALNWDSMADSKVGLFFENQQHLYVVPHAG
jgi:hypothetical protein